MELGWFMVWTLQKMMHSKLVCANMVVLCICIICRLPTFNVHLHPSVIKESICIFHYTLVSLQRSDALTKLVLQDQIACTVMVFFLWKYLNPQREAFMNVFEDITILYALFCCELVGQWFVCKVKLNNMDIKHSTSSLWCQMLFICTNNFSIQRTCKIHRKDQKYLCLISVKNWHDLLKCKLLINFEMYLSVLYLCLLGTGNYCTEKRLNLSVVERICYTHSLAGQGSNGTGELLLSSKDAYGDGLFVSIH